MKKTAFSLVALIALLTACGESSSSIQVNEPKKDETKIAGIEAGIEYYDSRISEMENKLKEYEEQDNEIMIDMQKELIEDIEINRNVSLGELELAQNTYYYNEDFSTVYDYAILSKTNDSVLTLENHADNFSSTILEEVKFYLDEGLIDKGLIATSAVLLSETNDYTRAITVYLSKETLNSMDFDDVLESDRKDLYSEADAVWARHDFVDEEIIHNSRWATDGTAPEIFSLFIGGTAE